MKTKIGMGSMGQNSVSQMQNERPKVNKHQVSEKEINKYSNQLFYGNKK